uniref:Bth1 n=1 Tax=Arundo donax TaxID=35708 RepID=A0A0A9CVG7_ARUDO
MRSLISRGTPLDLHISTQALAASRNSRVSVSFSLNWTMVAPPSMAAFTASFIERPHFLFIPESVTAYRKRSSGLNLCSDPILYNGDLSLKRWSKGP